LALNSVLRKSLEAARRHNVKAEQRSQIEEDIAAHLEAARCWPLQRRWNSGRLEMRLGNSYEPHHRAPARATASGTGLSRAALEDIQYSIRPLKRQQRGHLEMGGDIFLDL